MLKPTVMTGECSIHVMVRGILLMTIPHKMWESGVNESGECGWSGRNRGEDTVQRLVKFIEGKINGCQTRAELFSVLNEVLLEMRNPVWNQVGKKKKKKDGTDMTAPGGAAPMSDEAVGVEELRWAA